MKERRKGNRDKEHRKKKETDKALPSSLDGDKALQPVCSLDGIYQGHAN